jgi:hypothetical protein
MSIAEHIVEVLLGEARECAGCQKELGVTDPQGTSHGLCRRHFSEYYGQDFSPNEVSAMPNEHFTRDRSQRPQQAFAAV